MPHFLSECSPSFLWRQHIRQLLRTITKNDLLNAGFTIASTALVSHDSSWKVAVYANCETLVDGFAEDCWSLNIPRGVLVVLFLFASGIVIELTLCLIRFKLWFKWNDWISIWFLAKSSFTLRAEWLKFICVMCDCSQLDYNLSLTYIPEWRVKLRYEWLVVDIWIGVELICSW